MIAEEQKSEKTGRRCPCEFLELAPCSPRCTCRNRYHRGGCRRCCTYGSFEQQLSAAKRLVAVEETSRKLETSVHDGAGPFSIGSTVWPGLSKLIEEAGEVLQVAGKLMGTGGAVEHWDGTNLRERLQEEMGDVQAACRFMLAVNPSLDAAVVAARAEMKLALFHKWHRETHCDDHA